MGQSRNFNLNDMPLSQRAARLFAQDCAERLMFYFSRAAPGNPARDKANAAFVIGSRDAQVSARDVANELVHWASNKRIERVWIEQQLYEYGKGEYNCAGEVYGE